jgi:hypothetical protein
VTIKVAAGSYDEAWQIVQSPFMTEKARTTGFQMTLTVGNGRLSYAETTLLDIYGKTFEHTDDNALVRTGD